MRVQIKLRIIPDDESVLGKDVMPALKRVMTSLRRRRHDTSLGNEERIMRPRLPTAMASAVTISITATANVIHMPVVTAWGGAVAMSVVDDATANTAPMTDAPVMSLGLRRMPPADRLLGCSR